jgi:phenylalanyl-tRNA synthetase beta chain
MLETGQPLHAFDADKLQNNHIIVRRAKAGERLTTLDEVERTLNEDTLVIADPGGAIAIAGVMGGGDSEVTESTTRILLESAHFAPARVRRGSRGIGMKTEASRRFERWVDPNGCARAARRAAGLLVEHAGATAADAVADRYLQPVRDAEVTLRVTRCNAILGLQLSEDMIAAALQRLGFKIVSQIAGVLQVAVPTWRRDIEREIDLIEEVARIHGYGNIPTTLPRGANLSAGRPLAQRLEDRAKSALLRCGLNEIVTYSLQNEAAVERAGVYDGRPEQATVQLRNPLSEDYTQLRTSLIPSLLEVLEKNGNRQARIFEVGRVYLPQQGAKQPQERRRIGIALLDAPPAAHWQKDVAAKVDFFTLKATVQRMLEALGAPQAQYRAAKSPPFHPGRCAALSIDDEDLGLLGELHPDIAERYDLRHRAYIAVIDFDALVRHISLMKEVAPISRFPSADRDLALVLPASVPAASVEATIANSGGDLLESVRIFDVYTGAPIPEGYKSLALALSLRAADRSLTEGEVEAAMQSILNAVEQELQAKMRA